jgi:phosphopantothenoylcysteine decarboxylase/phosphopantothenate--cysteine ligase
LWAGEHKTDKQYLVGFALETNDLKENGTEKLRRKNLNIIVMNTLEDSEAGFGFDTNKISILDNRNNFKIFELKSKAEVAKDVLLFLKKYIS